MNPHNPIEHVVIIVKENHTFDNYFGTFPGANGVNLPHAQDPPAGGDPPHDHAAWLETVNGTRTAVKEQYQESDIFITWDDWGGWYDHVPAPPKDKWTGGNPNRGPAYTGTQFSYGQRVGCLVLSPYSKKGISKAFHSHVSLVTFCEKTFGLPALNPRDAASDDMSDCFDFSQSPLAPPS